MKDSKVAIICITIVAVVALLAASGIARDREEPKAQVDYCQELTQGRMPEVCK